MTARVCYDLSRTINTGNFESAKISVALEMDCEHVRGEIEKAYRRCKAFVDQKVEEEEAKWRL